MATTGAGALRGRFVRFDLPGDNSRYPRDRRDGAYKVINLAELQVFQGDRNIADGKRRRSPVTLTKADCPRIVRGW